MQTSVKSDAPTLKDSISMFIAIVGAAASLCTRHDGAQKIAATKLKA